MNIASPSRTMWIFPHIGKLIVAQIADIFPLFRGICRFTAAIQLSVYCNFQQSYCTLQPFVSHRRFDHSFASSSVAVTAVHLLCDHCQSISAALGLIGTEELRRPPQVLRLVSHNTASLCVLSVTTVT